MEKNCVRVYCGNGNGKSSAALGFAVRAASEGKTTYIIQFLKAEVNYDYLSKLEPEIKIFRFERSKECFDELSAEEKEEEKQNIRNGMNYAKKVIGTGECDMLILDEVLGTVAEGIISADELLQVLDANTSGADIILTGRVLPDSVKEKADLVFDIVQKK